MSEFIILRCLLWVHKSNVQKALSKWWEDFVFGRYAKGVEHGRHTQGISFLPKMAHERVMGRTSGRGLPALSFFTAYPLHPHPCNVWLQNWCKIKNFVYIHQHLDSHSLPIISIANKAFNIQAYEYFFFLIYFSCGCSQCIFLSSKTCPLVHSCLVFVYRYWCIVVGDWKL